MLSNAYLIPPVKSTVFLTPTPPLIMSTGLFIGIKVPIKKRNSN